MGDTDNGEKPRGGRRWVCKALRLGMCRCVWADQPFSVSTNAQLVSFKDEGDLRCLLQPLQYFFRGALTIP